MSGDVSRRGRGPWKPERGQYIRLWPTRIELPEWYGFVLALVFCAGLLAVSVLFFR